ncbi:MAG: vWA domain-containing protein, partial [Actinomycetota bacterium]
MNLPDFTVEVDQNEYLPEGGQDVSAIVTVTSAATGPAEADYEGTPEAGAAEIIIVYCSGSMSSPGNKMGEARAATAAAVEVIRDGAAFAVIAGTELARPIFPRDGSLAIADPQTRAAAQRAVAGLRPGGGTAIGRWLELAHQMFRSHSATLRHAILLTDGKNQHETPTQL